MSSIGDITVYDGASTPVAHILKAVSVARDSAKGIIASWREQLAAVPVYAQVSAMLSQRKLSGGNVTRTELVVEVPVMESVSGQNAAGYTAAPKVAYVDKVVVLTFAHERSTETSKRLARMIAVNLLNNVSTSVAAATSGPVPQAFDQEIMPT